MHQLSRYLYPLAAALFSLTNASPLSPENPVVDLSYTLQQASDFNRTGNYYTFSNIAYAQPPIGHLRFRAPQPPLTNRTVQNPGSGPRSCSQSIPPWLGPESPIGPFESEDCLYLDVFVPKPVLEQARRGCADSPVLVWIHGGGSVLGSKTSNGDPSGLLAQKYAKERGMIFVALNYRLGAFGFLNGPEFNKETGTPNAALLDQRLALEWVQKYIARFGGSIDKITLMGESGGAQYIVHHLSANQKRYGKLSVKQALLQSVAGFPVASDVEQNHVYEQWKAALRVKTLDAARALDTKVLQEANRRLTQQSPYGTFKYNVETKEGGYVERSVAQSILSSAKNYNVQVMVGSNDHEGTIFVDSTSNSSFSELVDLYLPDANASTRSFISNKLYPAPKHSSSSDELARKQLFAGELIFDCNGYAVQKAYSGSGYSYRFSVPPAYHTFDLPYTWYSGHEESLPQGFNATVAKDMQAYFTKFAATGDPNGRSYPVAQMPRYGDGKVLNLANDGFQTILDPSKTARCEFLIKM